MLKNASSHPILISALEEGTPMVTMVQEAESIDVPMSAPKVCSDGQYDPSQQVLSVLVRHTYNAEPENLEKVDLENHLVDHLHQKTTRNKYGDYKCSFCGKQYSLKSCYDRHLKFLCEVINKAKPKETEKDIPLLPRLRVRKPANPIAGEGPEKVQNDTVADEFDIHSSNEEAEANEPLDTADKAKIKEHHKGEFICSLCGNVYFYKSWYDRHRKKGCGPRVNRASSSSLVPKVPVTEETNNNAWQPFLEIGEDGRYFPSNIGHHLDTVSVVASAGPSPAGSDPTLGVQQWLVESVPRDQIVYCCSVPYCGQSFMEEGALVVHQRQHFDHGRDAGGNEKRERPKRVLGDQAFCEPSGSIAPTPTLEPESDFLSMIQISNVMSLVTSQEEILPTTGEAVLSAGKEREPEGNNSSSVPKDVTPHTADKLNWQSLIQRCIRNRRSTTRKWLLSGGRRAVCLLCGRPFGCNKTLDQHMVSAHCEKFQFRCGSCHMSFKARACLCRHVLQAHCDLKKLKCCVCKLKYRAAHHLQRHVLKQHSNSCLRKR
ncbi:hypothetical protein GJAV_G00029260 [Gymnothorax javanicus]|nr:hypothetical protein GJAV_G00029260 [Gymnothorax javanicus]